MNSIKGAPELQKENSRVGKGAWRKSNLEGQPLITMLPLRNSDQQKVHWLVYSSALLYHIFAPIYE